MPVITSLPPRPRRFGPCRPLGGRAQDCRRHTLHRADSHGSRRRRRRTFPFVSVLLICFPFFFPFVATLLRRAGSKGIAIRRTKLIMAQTRDQSRLPTNKRESICTDTVYQCSSKSIKISPGEVARNSNRRIPFESDFACHLIKSHGAPAGFIPASPRRGRMDC